MTSVLTWGSVTPVRASSSRVGEKSVVRPISSVWRFGRDSRHLTNRGILDLFHARYTVTNLQRTRIID